MSHHVPQGSELKFKSSLGLAPSSLIQRITRQMTVFSHWDQKVRPYDAGLMSHTAFQPSLLLLLAVAGAERLANSSICSLHRRAD